MVMHWRKNRALPPMRTAFFPPVHDHAGLRKREGQKSAHGIERYEPIGDAAEKDEQAAAEHRQDDDAVGIDEPTHAVHEGVREVVVLRDGAAEAGGNGGGGGGGGGGKEKK